MYDDHAELEKYLATFPALVRVIPVARQLRATTGLGVYLESVAIYTTSITIRYSQVAVDRTNLIAQITAGTHPDDIDDAELWPDDVHAPWTISDDASTPYEGHGIGGGGGGRLMSMSVSFTPAPSPEATTLTLSYRDQSVQVDLADGVAAH